MRRFQAVLAVAAFAAAAVGCGMKPKKPKDDAPSAGPIDDRNTNYRPGAGAMLNAAKAGKRLAAMSDFEQLKTIMFAMELENGRMPTKDDLRAELARNGQNLLKLIDEGAILLPPAITKTGVWAYEVDADKAGGIVVTGGNVERKSADDAKALIGQK